MDKFYGRVLKYDSSFKGEALKEFYRALPKRKDFIDKELNKQIEHDIKIGKSINFMPTDVFETHLNEGGANKNSRVYRLVLTGTLEDGSAAAVILEDIDVFIDAKVPDDADFDKFYDSMRSRLRDQGIYPTHLELKKMKPFKYYQKEESDYIRIYFNSLHQRHKAHKYFKSGDHEYATKDEILKVSDIETASNDSCYSSSTSKQGTVYFRKAAREYKFTMGDWNIIADYMIDDSGFIRKAMRPYTFRTSVDNFTPLSKVIDKQKVESLKLDKTLVQCRDYETYSNKPTGNAPVPENVLDKDNNELDIIFMSGVTYHWRYDTNPFLVVNITSLPVPPRDDCLIIQVMDQIDIIKLEALLISRMSPDILTGFNDGMYDNPFMFRRAETYDRIFKTNIVKWIRKQTSCVRFDDETDKYLIGGIAKEENIKIEADQYATNEFLNTQGLISIDTRTIFRQRHPTSEQNSLNFFLKMYKLELKEDMEYTTMFRIYHLFCRYMELLDTRDYDTIINYLLTVKKNYGDDYKPLSQEGMVELNLVFKPKGEVQSNNRPWYSHIDMGRNRADNYTVSDQILLLQDVTKVVKYCNVDSTRCMDLLVAGNVIPDKREISILSYTSLYDCFYRAGGMKVRNLVISVGIEPEWNIAFDNSSRGEKTDKKYPGAYVVPPKKNLSRDHVITKRKRRMLQRLKAQNNIHSGSAINKTETQTKTKNKNKNQKENKNDDNFPVEEVSPDNELFDKSLLNPNDERWKIDPYMRVSNDENEEIDRPCTGLDFSSLYPSLVMAYNLSPEKAIKAGVDLNALTEELIIELKKTRPELFDKKNPEYKELNRSDIIHESEFRYGFDDQNEQDKELINGQFIRYIPKMVDGKMTYPGMGLYPFILLNLFNDRSVVKKKMNYYDLPKEFMETLLDEKEFNKSKEDTLKYLEKMLLERKAVVEQHKNTQKEAYYAYQVTEVEKVISFMNKEWINSDGQYRDQSFDELYKIVCFYASYFNTKQLAIKVFMNTFYGETGNAISPFFIVQVAGSITTAGKNNIHMVKNYVESQEYRVDYGDTDSLYICPPEKKFIEVDDLYVKGMISKLDYWTKMIEITMETIDKFKDDVNMLLFNDNGTQFLKMAYEEVLFPYAMVGKKKYIGIKHEGIVNLSACLPTITAEEFMKSKSLFIRGLNIKKRGASTFLKVNSYSALRDMFNLETTRSMCEIFEQKLSEVAQGEFAPELFVRTAKYKLPGKNEFGEDKQGNVTVLEFAKRMIDLETNHPELGIKCPELGERFPYVVARKDPYRYDMRGRKHQIKIGEKYEDFRYFYNTKYHQFLGGEIEIDRDYYMTNEISGQFARFVVYHPKYDKFCRDNIDPSLLNDDEYKEADKKAVDFAKRELQNYYKQNFAFQYEERGDHFKALYKDKIAVVDKGLSKIYGNRSFLFQVTNSVTTDTDDRGNYKYAGNDMKNEIVNKLCTKAKKEAACGMKLFIRTKLKMLLTNKKDELPISATRLYKKYISGKNSIKKLVTKEINIDVEKIRKELEKHAKTYQKLCLQNTKIITKLIDHEEKGNYENDPEISFFKKLEDVGVGGGDDEDNSDTDVPEYYKNDELNESIEEMYMLYTQLVGLYKTECELEEMATQLMAIKDKEAGVTHTVVKKVEKKKMIDQLQDWLSNVTITDNNDTY